MIAAPSPAPWQASLVNVASGVSYHRVTRTYVRTHGRRVECMYVCMYVSMYVGR